MGFSETLSVFKLRVNQVFALMRKEGPRKQPPGRSSFHEFLEPKAPQSGITRAGTRARTCAVNTQRQPPRPLRTSPAPVSLSSSKSGGLCYRGTGPAFFLPPSVEFFFPPQQWHPAWGGCCCGGLAASWPRPPPLSSRLFGA